MSKSTIETVGSVVENIVPEQPKILTDAISSVTFADLAVRSQLEMENATGGKAQTEIEPIKCGDVWLWRETQMNDMSLIEGEMDSIKGTDESTDTVSTDLHCALYLNFR